MVNFAPPPAILVLDVVTTNQTDQVGTVLGMSRCESAKKVRQNIRYFRAANLTEKHIVVIGGDGFTAGQTNMKSVLVEFFGVMASSRGVSPRTTALATRAAAT